MAQKPTTKTRGARKPQYSLNWLSPFVADLFVTCVWTAASSLCCEVADGIKQVPWFQEFSDFTLNTTVLLVALIAVAPLCTACGGAMFNPVNALALVSSGKGQWSTCLLRMVAQMLGTAAGSVVATQLVPSNFQGKFRWLAGGLRPGVELPAGFACEALLGLAMNLLFLYSIDAKNRYIAYWLPLGSTVGMCYIGGLFTGPSLNPGAALVWNWHYPQHTLVEHLVVFWAAPITGAVTAGLLWHHLTRPKKQRKAKKQQQAKPKQGQQQQQAKQQQEVKAEPKEPSKQQLKQRKSAPVSAAAAAPATPAAPASSIKQGKGRGGDAGASTESRRITRSASKASGKAKQQ